MSARSYKQFSKRKTAHAYQTSKEVSAADFIPYDYHWDDETLITKKGEFMQIVRVDGFSFETADDEDVDMKKMVRNSILKSMSDGDYAIWFHMIRRRKSAFPKGKFRPGFGQLLNEQWKAKRAAKQAFVNELYVSVVRKADTAGLAKVEYLLTRMMQGVDNQQKRVAMQEAHKDLKDVVNRLVASLRDYGAELLTTHYTENGPISEPLEFLSRLVNCGESGSVQVPMSNLSNHLPTQRIYFGSRAIEFRGLTRTRYGAILSIREYPSATASGFMDGFLHMPFELIVTHSYNFVNRQASIASMQTKQRRMMAAQDKAITQVIEIGDALDLATGGTVAFGMHQMTVLVIEDDLKAMENALSMAVAEMVNVGFNPVRERMVLEQTFWSQLPGNFDFVARPATLHSLNIAAMASLHNYPTGRIAGNHWGDAVSVLDTTSGTPYFFNFHVRDVGHSTIIGPTGAGKTVLMNFLCAQAQKFNCRLFFFDKDRGAEIFIRAIRGTYNIIEPGERCDFNPLQLPDTLENRNFIGEWLQALVTAYGEPLTAEDMALITDAVNGNYKLAKKDRMLRNIAPFLGMDGPGTLAGRLRMWHSGGQYAKLFDNPYDSLDFSTHATFGFEMGPVLANKMTLAPVLLYLFHKINLSLDGTPTMIVLDEAWALIDNPIFATKIKDWLKTLRKLNAFVIFATQSVEDAASSSISDTLIQQTATQIFLPNPKATAAYRNAFMISEREFNLIKNTDPGTRYFLVKQNKDVVVARIDLSGMTDVVNILSARADTVRVLDEIRAQVGDDPDQWMPIFFERVRRL
jgi:type IV secretion system protein VirB4